MRNPNSPAPPRLTTEPIPLPPFVGAVAAGGWAGAGAVYDLDRLEEYSFQVPRLAAEYETAKAACPPADTPEGVAARGAADRHFLATVAAFLCAGCVAPDGTPVGGELDSPEAWDAVPAPILRWVIREGLEAAQGIGAAPFLTAAPVPLETAPPIPT